MNENTRRIINVNLEWKVILNMARTFLYSTGLDITITYIIRFQHVSK